MQNSSEIGANLTCAGIYSDELVEDCMFVDLTSAGCGQSWAITSLAVLCAGITILNVLNLLAIRKTSEIWNSASAKGLINLAISDLVNALFVIAINNCGMQKFMRRKANLLLCAFSFSVTTGMMALSGIILSLMSLERCIFICLPFIRRKRVLHIFKALYGVLWAAVGSSIFGITWNSAEKQKMGGSGVYCYYGVGPCGLQWSKGGTHLGISGIACVALAITLMIATSAAVFCKVFSSRKFSQQANRINSKSIHAAKTIGLMCIVFVFSWFGTGIWMAVRVVNPKSLKFWHSHAAYLLLATNSLINPLVYGLLSKPYRGYIGSVWYSQRIRSMAASSRPITSIKQT